MRLELDAGNTRIKWRVCDHRACYNAGSDLKQVLQEEPSWLPLVEDVWASSVHDEQSQWIQERFPQVQFAHAQVAQHGLSNSYEDAHKMGVDRWLAMLGAWSQAPDVAHIVVDAGTAITLDMIDEFGRHVGGYICPGLQMMKTSLLASTNKVLAESQWQVGRAPGTSTQQCVDHGIQDLLASWIEQHRALQPNAKVWLTGGNGEGLSSLLHESVNYQPDLVLDGLSVYFSK